MFETSVNLGSPPFPEFAPENTLFLLLSFEGPDIYSQAGGLGVRMSELSRSLAEAGYETHLFFIGDPNLPGIETLLEGKLIYHRWCQWISRYHPTGVYDGQEGKMLDYQRSLPDWISKNIFPKTQKKMAIMGEEWQTAKTTIALSKLAKTSGANPNTRFLWNANNGFGFDRINWTLLQHHATLTTVSRYMKQLMSSLGLEPLVIPNGIPERWFQPIQHSLKDEFRKGIGGDLLLAKIGRFDPSKQWLMAIQSLAQLRQLGLDAKLIMRGGLEPHGDEVRALAQNLGLNIKTLKLRKDAKPQDLFEALHQSTHSDILDLQSFVSEEILRLVYFSADAVLANSSHEPFGLVGLEVMASGGLAVTGNTGEDYARNFQNAIVVDTRDPLELTTNLRLLASSPSLADQIRARGKESAKSFLWPNIIDELKRKLAFKIGDTPRWITLAP